MDVRKSFAKLPVPVGFFAVLLMAITLKAQVTNATGQSAAAASEPRASLLVVLAHPDDEIFLGGVLANLSERGVRVTLVSATKGEAGRPHQSVGTVQDLGALRAAELQQSCERLGIEKPIFLGFDGSGRNERLRRDDPHALAIADMLEVETAIRRVIEEVRPQIILTFDPHGAYYHPDHVAIGRATTAAFFSSGVMGTSAPERLFYWVMSRNVFRAFGERMRGKGLADGLDPDVFGVDPVMIAVSFDARKYLDRKFSALAAHRSAFGVTEEMIRSPGARVLDEFRPAFQEEDYVLAAARVATPTWPLRDFFDGTRASVSSVSAAR